MSPQQIRDLEKSFSLLGFHGQNTENTTAKLTKADVQNVVRCATDRKLDDEDLSSVMEDFGHKGELGLAEFKQLLSSGRLRRQEHNRFWVAVSLAEAETLKRILHIRRQKDVGMVDSKDVEIALRYSPSSTLGTGGAGTGDGGLVMDISRSFTPATCYQTAVAHTCYRFFDCDMHYSDAALNVGVRALQNSTPGHRERFFLSTVGCRRRMERKWRETPLSKILSCVGEWAALKYRAFAVFLRESIRSKQLTLWFELFCTFSWRVFTFACSSSLCVFVSPSPFIPTRSHYISAVLLF
jgi:hypothetical protein